MQAEIFGNGDFEYRYDLSRIADTSLAAYCPVVNVVNSSIYDSGDLCNPSGIVVGTNACFAVGFKMVQPPASEIAWSVVEGSARFVGTGFGTRQLRI